MKRTYTFKLDIRKHNPVRIPGIVNGDTANVFVITVTDDDTPIAIDSSLNRVIAVFHRSDGSVYTQDSTSGVSISNTGDVVIDVSASSFSTGKNSVELQIYTRETPGSTTYKDLVTTQYAEYAARAATLVGEGETAPSQIPMLEQLITNAQDAIDAAEEATAAAQEATRLAHLAAQSATRAIASIPFIVTAEDPLWNGLEFTAYADCTNETYENAVEVGRPIIVRVLGSDEDSVITMYQVSRDAGTHDVICENTWMECSIIVGGAMLQVSGGPKHT